MMRKWTRIMLTAVLVVVVLSMLMSTMPVSAQTVPTWDPNLGWDFQCHSHTHPHFTKLTADEIHWELEQVNVAFKAHGYDPPKHHAYPYGDSTSHGKDKGMIMRVVAEYRLSGREVWGKMETYPIADWYSHKSAQLRRSTTWRKITAWIEDCIANNALLHIFTHDVSEKPSGWGCKTEMLIRLLDYLVEKQNAGLLTVVTMAEAYDYWSTATEGKAMVVLSFDDAWETDFTTVYPLFKERGLKGTSYIVTSFIGQPDRLTWAQIDLMRTGA